MKQTAVEWLNEQMNNIKGSSISMNGSVQFIEKELNNLFKQAKAMEKEQSECICVNVIEMILDESEQGKEINSKEIFEKCYKETFKSE